MPGYTWLNDEAEHSEEDCARAGALAARLSAMKDEDEKRQWARQSDADEGRDYGARAAEDCECAYCVWANHRCDRHDGICTYCCAGPGGLKQCSTLTEFRQRETALRAERELERELCHDKLAKLGARLMRPYEHWNEDERLMAYMERER